MNSKSLRIELILLRIQLLILHSTNIQATEYTEKYIQIALISSNLHNMKLKVHTVTRELFYVEKVKFM